jgi:protein involved in polysaccharide export with SLBB domain
MGHMIKRGCVLTRSVLLLAANCLLTAAAFAQQQTPVQAQTAPSTVTVSGSSTEHTAADEDESTVLPANKIIVILHEKPEVIIDLKRVMADYLQQQGTPMQEDSITDEMLFNGIASNAGLRGAISTWLRARGYVTDADFQKPQSDRREEENADGRRMASSSPAFSGLSSNSGQLSTSVGVLDPTRLGSSASTLQDNGVAQENEMSRRSVERDPYTKNKADEPEVDAPQILHQAAPYNLQSLRDLYSQVPDQTSKLKRFGSDVFLSRGLAAKEMSIDLPIGPDYIVGVGDGIAINLWGGVSQSFTRVIDREGTITLPEAGSIEVAGLTLERMQALIESKLTQQYKNAKVAVSVARLRTVRVYVVGDVQRPGAYDISSLSTPLNALYAAGGPTSIGSLRTLQHYRGKTLVREVDLYDLMLRGVRADVERLEPGDTILVPPAGSQVAVAGMVKRPAIYELRDETKLSNVLDDAGGLRASAALSHITIERIEADGHRATLNLNLSKESTPESARKQIDSFVIRDGDRVTVAPILPYSEKAIYLEGHVVRPGKYPYREGMRLDNVLRSYQDLLPEPSDLGEIVRLMPPDLRPETIDFSVPDALAGNEQIHLQPFDTIRIVGRYEADAPKVTIRGEVLRPGGYALSRGMTAAQLVKMAGGFKRNALLDEADLTSYQIKEGKELVSTRESIKIGEAVKGPNNNADVVLKPGDVLTIHEVSGWSDIGASITLNGEVTYPGPYGLQAGERLSSVLLRAGGFRSAAYPAGAVLVRPEVRELEEKSRLELIHQLESTSAGARLSPSLSGQEDAATLQLLIHEQNEMVEKLRAQHAVGRLVIKISPDIASWAGTVADIELRNGDVLTIPKKPGFVLVTGQVYNASAITYVPGKNAGWYLKRAGGSTELANRKEVLVIRANGSIVGRRSGEWYDADVLSTRLNPGDVVVVPQKIFGGSPFWKNVLAVSQVVTSVGFTAALALR